MTALVIVLGCGPSVVLEADPEPGGSSTDTDITSGTAGPSTTGMPPSTSGNADDSVGSTIGDESGPADDDAGFIPPTDAGGIADCDIFTQDCPPGSKCMPWASDGGSSWNATRCSPIAADPAAVGEPCNVEGSGVSGIDDCEFATMCWDVDPRTNMGRCVSLCSGSGAAPMCGDPDEACSIAGDGVLALCLPLCDPVEQDCGEGQACVPVHIGFACVPIAGDPPGEYGMPCEFLNACNAGLYCAAADTVPGCKGSAGCCSELCDLNSDLGDAQCTGAPEGQQCVAWDDDPLPTHTHVGACAL